MIDGADSGAVLSDCGLFRHFLWRYWNRLLPRLLFVMLNPSTADATTNDPTVDTICAIAKALGFGGVVVVNLYDFRTVSPKVLAQRGYPISDANDATIATFATVICEEGGKIVAAWGNNAQPERAARVRQLLADCGVDVYALGLNKNGSPKHPLYMKHSVHPFLWPCEDQLW